jgi:hypothetical protein
VRAVPVKVPQVRFSTAAGAAETEMARRKKVIMAWHCILMVGIWILRVDEDVDVGRKQGYIRIEDMLKEETMRRKKKMLLNSLKGRNGRDLISASTSIF